MVEFSRGTSASASSGWLPTSRSPSCPTGVASVLSVLRSSAVVVGADDTVLKASAPAYAMGLVSGTSLMSHELAELVTAGPP